MSLPAPTAPTDPAAPQPLPLVHRTFGEPQFHTDGDIAAIAFAADGSLRSVDEAGLLRHWSADGNLLSRHFLSDLETVWCFGPGAKLIASGNDDLLVWDAAIGQLVRRIEQDSWVTTVAFSPDGRTIASGHDDGKVRFWDAASQKLVGQLKAHPNPVSAIALAPAKDLIATAGEDRIVRVWDAVSHKLITEL
jgi:WD40 repeat protein